MGSKAGTSYKLKSTTGKANANLYLYNEEQLEYIREKFAPYLYLFGYANHPTEENPTAFFEYKEHKPEHLEKYYGFRKMNSEAIAKLVRDGGKKSPGYKVNTDGCFPLFDDNVLDRVQMPARDWAERKLGYRNDTVPKE
jgi:hypothetical protein